MKPLKTSISITIDEDLLERVKIEAEKDDRSVSQFINIILKNYKKLFLQQCFMWRETVHEGKAPQ